MYYHNIQYISSKNITDAERNALFSASVISFMTLRLPYFRLLLIGYAGVSARQKYERKTTHQ